MSVPTPATTLWRLAIATWVAAIAAGAALALLHAQRPKSLASVSCEIDRAGGARWYLKGSGDAASASDPTPAEIARMDAVALEAPGDAPARALVDALHSCARQTPIAVALAAPGATTATPTFLVIAPRVPDPLEIDSDPVAISMREPGTWRIDALAVSVEAASTDVGSALARIRGPGRAIAATQPIEIRCATIPVSELRDVLVGLLKEAPEARLVLVGGSAP